MTRLAPALLCLAELAACDAPARSQAWFEAHPRIAAQVVASCGGSQSKDCTNAQIGLATVRRDARLSAYRKGF